MRAEILLLISIGNVELDELYSFAGAKHNEIRYGASRLRITIKG
jgi:hypothetical protein